MKALELSNNELNMVFVIYFVIIFLGKFIIFETNMKLDETHLLKCLALMRS